MGVYTGFRGKTLRTLGTKRLWIDSEIPGVIPQTEEDQRGVRNVVVSWYGPRDALKLSAVMERSPHFDRREFRSFSVEGHHLTE